MACQCVDLNAVIFLSKTSVNSLNEFREIDCQGSTLITGNVRGCVFLCKGIVGVFLSKFVHGGHLGNFFGG